MEIFFGVLESPIKHNESITLKKLLCEFMTPGLLAKELMRVGQVREQRPMNKRVDSSAPQKSLQGLWAREALFAFFATERPECLIWLSLETSFGEALSI